MIKWDEKYSVGISIIDEEHKKLFEILNKAFFANRHNDNPKEIREILREMSKYARRHFATEEAYMKKFNLPEYHDHKEEHRDFIAEIIAYDAKMLKGDNQIASEIIKYLKWWLVNHIQVTDKKYISCFHRHGL